MADTITREQFVEAFLLSLDETFDNVQGIYLDRGTSLFETLATITAEEASAPISPSCATIAAHVIHTAFYMEVTVRYVKGDHSRADWSEIWNTVSVVTEEEWGAAIQRLRNAYTLIQQLAHETTWQSTDEIVGAMGVLAHNAYHLGEIRQALCMLKPNR